MIEGPDVHWRVFDLDLKGPIIQVGEGILKLDGGYRSEGGGTVWSSTNGAVWTVVADLIGDGVDADSVGVSGVSRSGSLVGAWGWYTLAGNGGEVAAIWTSADGGETWTMPDLAGVVSVVTTPEGFLAIGVDHDTTSVFTNDMTAWVRTSVDGVEWELAFESGDPDGHGSNAARGVWHDGLVVLGAQFPLFQPKEDTPDIPDNWPFTRVVWLDGSPIPVESNHPGLLLELVPTHWGVIGLAPYGLVPGTVWVSSDGTEWGRADLGDGWRAAVADYADRKLYVSAWKPSAGGDPVIEDARIWVSQDGESWRLITVPEEVSMGLDLSVVGSRVVLVGWDGTGFAKIAIGTITPD